MQKKLWCDLYHSFQILLCNFYSLPLIILSLLRFNCSLELYLPLFECNFGNILSLLLIRCCLYLFK